MALYEVLADGTIVHKAGKNVGNLDCLRTEVVYDMSSSDSSINWGYTSGIQGGVTISGKDLSKYNKLVIHTNQLGLQLTLIYEMNSSAPEQSISGLSSDNKAVMTVKCSATNTSFGVISIGYWNSSGSFADRNANASYVVTKIEGILKTPSMIYTGKELFSEKPALNTTRLGQNDTVVEYFVSSDATTWYRKWASGWKECGGCFMSADTSSGVYLAFPITFEQSVHAIQFTDTESVWNSHGCIPKALYWPENEPANYDGKAGMRVLTPALNVGTLYAKHRISYYAQGY